MFHWRYVSHQLSMLHSLFPCLSNFDHVHLTCISNLPTPPTPSSPVPYFLSFLYYVRTPYGICSLCQNLLLNTLTVPHSYLMRYLRSAFLTAGGLVYPGNISWHCVLWFSVCQYLPHIPWRAHVRRPPMGLSLSVPSGFQPWGQSFAGTSTWVEATSPGWYSLPGDDTVIS